MRPQPLICVSDVEASSRWYQHLLGCHSDHGGPQYERLVAHEQLVLHLHRWDVEHHTDALAIPTLRTATASSFGLRLPISMRRSRAREI